MPVDWDDTRIIETEPGDYITTACKQKGKANWFLGVITDENARISTIKLGFLDNNASYQATIYKDSPTANWQINPESYVIEKVTVTNKSMLTLNLAKGGGCAVSFDKVNYTQVKVVLENYFSKMAIECCLQKPT